MNVANRTLFIADNLPVMRGIDSETIDLIYLDPPFGSKKTIKGKKLATNASFKDFWSEEDIEKEWHGEISEIHEEIYQFIQATAFLVDQNIKNYLTAMAVRLFEMKRILKPTGSIYLHCDRTASHYLKGILDGLFGKQNFRNEIIWKRHSGHNDKVFGHIHETIFCYSTESVEISDDIRIPITNTTKGQSDHRKRKHGTYTTICLTAADPSHGESGEPWQNVDPGNRHWSPPLTGEYAKYIEDHFISNYRSFKSVHKRLDLLDKAGLIQWSDNNNPRLKKYKKAQKGKLPQSIWTDIPNCSGKEYIGYPTQKPLKLLERIIKISSNEDDIVLDPFCGCATACVAAEKLNRKWIGIDQSPSAEDITKLRLQEIVDESSNLWNPLEYVTVSNTPPSELLTNRKLLFKDVYLPIKYTRTNFMAYKKDIVEVVNYTTAIKT